MYRPNSPWTWAFIGVTVTQAIIVLVFESYVFAIYQGGLHVGPNTAAGQRVNGKEADDYRFTIPTFLALYIFGLLYELLLVWDALRLKNTIQIIGLCLYNAGLLVYAAVQIDQINDVQRDLRFRPGDDGHPQAIDLDVWTDVRPFLIAIPCVIAVGTVAMSFVARKLYDEFAWTIYKHISADLRMKRRYLTYQIYIALLKFDFFFFLGFTIQFIVIIASRNSDKTEFGLTVAAIPVNIVILILAGYVTRKEWMLAQIAIITLYFAGLAYFFFKLVRMYQHNAIAAQYLSARKPLTAFAILTIICVVATIINAIACAINFNKGLKPYIAHRKVEAEDEKPVTGHGMEMPNLNYTSAPQTNRMTID